MLQEREIREEILRIVKDGKNNILNAVSGKDVVENYKSENEFVGHKLDDSGNLPQTAEMSAKEIDSKLKTENNQLKAENHEMRDKIKQVQKACFEAQNHIKQVEEELKNKQNDIIRLNSSLENAQKQINDLQTESKDWEKKYKDEKRNIATVSKRFQEKIVSLQNKNKWNSVFLRVGNCLKHTRMLISIQNRFYITAYLRRKLILCRLYAEGHRRVPWKNCGMP